MATSEFRQLIELAESETLDFKRDGYNVANSRSAFSKDVLAMANTPRDQPAHIVFGVHWTPESGSAVVGLRRQLDDAALQDALQRHRMQPAPGFIYTPYKFEGKQVGVLEIPIGTDGPYTPLVDFEGLQAGAVYYRRGTQNARAVGSELKRIFSWFQNRSIGANIESDTHSWNQFVKAIRGFEQDTIYLLVVDHISSTAVAPVYALGMPPWRAVIDFDPDSETSGFMNCVAATLGRERVLHRVVKGQYRVQPQPGTHWFFARGLSGHHETLLQSENHSAWLKTYKKELGRQLERLAGTFSPSPVLVLVLWSDVRLRSHLRTLLEELHGAFGNAVEIVVVSDDEPSFKACVEDSGATFFQMRLRSLCNGIAVRYADLHGNDDERHILPSPSGAPVEIDSTDWLWLSEGFDPLHRSIGINGDDDARRYRLGADVSWRNLHLHHDCDRDITHLVRGQVEADLKRRQTVRINIYHAPGSGGTTVGRRIAWDLHETFPVGILRKCSPEDAASRIAKVATLTESSVLVVVDGGQHSDREIDDLYELLRASQTPVVLLQVLRRFHPQENGRRQFWLEAQLTDGEADRFRDAYSRAEPRKSAPLSALARKRNDRKRNAFFFGLTAFEKHFYGLRRYVSDRITGLTGEQRRILVYIAIAHYYGQQAIPVQAFTSLLGLPQSRTFHFASAFTNDARHSLELLLENEKAEWRTAHHVIALEIMQQVLAPQDSQEHENVWRQNLSLWGKEFATFCQADEHPTSDRLLELARRVFIYRDNNDVLGTERAAQRQFAQLVDDVTSVHGRVEILRHLTECFPLEAHFHAHLGRLLGLSNEYDEAIYCVDCALSLQADDHVLHHIRGMILRQRMRTEAEANLPISRLIDTAKEATASFEETRVQQPDREHGYISEVQMLINLVDQAGRRSGVVVDVLARPSTDPFLKQALERAEDLLDRAHHLHAGEEPSQYVLQCRARLQGFYGNYQSALQAWDNLLARPEVAKPPVRRQIVWTLLRRRDGNWSNLSSGETDRVCRLLEENLEEETSDSTSLRLWLRAVRHSRIPPSMDSVIERVGYWKTNTGALDAAYYLYVLHVLRALDGSTQGAADAERALDECRGLARFRRDRTRSFEWVGPGDGIGALVHQSRLGDWVGDFWESADALVRLNGRICSIDAPQKGLIELGGGIEAFFVPAKSDFQVGRDENLPVTCYVGFSYDGPRAWDVLRAGV